MSATGNYIRVTARQLWRNPGFSLTVIFTLMVSIGANTAVFSLVNALMLKRLPYAHPERIGTIYSRVSGPQKSDQRKLLDGGQWELLRDNVPSLMSAISAVSSAGSSGVNFRAGSHVQYLHAGRISAHYLDVLGIQLVAGRNFSSEEDLPHGPKAAILSYALWRNVFSDDYAVIGQSIWLKGEPHTVVGVLPPGLSLPINADIYTALQPTRAGEGQGTNFEVITRLRDGATWQQADAEINRAWAAQAEDFERNNPGTQVVYYSVSLQKGETSELRPQILTLMLATGLILVIACANLAGLTLVRMLRRTPEFATRLAIGASRWQIQRQLMLESLMLALTGGIAAMGVGWITLRGMLSLLPEDFLPVARVPLDSQVLAFALLAALLTTVLFGTLPALLAGRADLHSSMATRTVAVEDRLRLRQVLIAGEVALTVVLLMASGLLIRTLIHLQTLPAGFNPEGVITAKVSLDDAKYRDPVAFRKLLDESISAMRMIPDAQNVAVGLTLPYERPLNDVVTFAGGNETGQQAGTDLVYVTPGYFDTLQMQLIAGRVFTDFDGPDSEHVAIVNQSFVRKFFHGANPVGRFVNKDKRVVGVINDVPVASGLNVAAPLTTEETMYIPAAQLDPQYISLIHMWFQPSWIVRTARPVEELIAPMQRALANVDPGLPFAGFYSMGDLLAENLRTQRIEVTLLTAMALMALLLSAVGIFVLVANVIVQRTREIALRIALGASLSQVIFRVSSSAAKASMAGLFSGLVLCTLLLRAMHGVLYGIGVYDAPTALFVVLTLLFVTFLAAGIPTLRIATIDPAKTLREE